MRLKDKVALITGAGSGFGRAIARRFAQEGAKVALNGRRREPLEKTLAEIEQAGGSALVAPGDVTREEDVRRVVDAVVRRFGRLDILVNNAGAIVARGPVTDISEADFRRTLDSNLLSVFLCSKHAIPELVKTRGTIVNIASLAGLRGAPNHAAYGPAKAAVVALTKNMALDHAAQGVRVNAVCPAFIETDLNREFLAGLRATGQYEQLAKAHPLGLRGTPEDVAHAAVYLASDEAGWVTGTMLSLDGGISATR